MKIAKQVPFYSNHDDDMHCMMSVYASIVEYFLGKKLSWRELESLTGYESGRAAWSVEALPRLADMGLDVRMIESFDYRRYLDEGEDYLKGKYSQEQLDWHYKNSNIREMQRWIPSFLDKIKHEVRTPSLKDIDGLLAEKRLIFVTLNSRRLNGRGGFVSHAILVIDKEGDEYIVHDPGLPPKPYRRINSDLLLQAMGGRANTAEVTGFKRVNE
ncbi:MAG TPA: hypothetical protein VG964_03445 [Candidatus Saccharimonadales bacterium]|nr:hypothetical protein [Candidatus Saccharimonadales bacterium]